MAFEVVRYPEWKTLYDALIPLIEGGQRDFDYELLSELARIDIRSDRGRGQFYRFRRELLNAKRLWMENVPRAGYTIVPASEQPRAAGRRVRMAKRKLRMARDINEYVRYEDMTPEQRLVQAATGAVLHQLSKTFDSMSRKLSIAGQTALKIPVDMKKLQESIEGKK